MGEAKRKREALRKRMLEDLESWTFPPSMWETQLAVELSEMDTVIARRLSSSQLADMRMPANKCHDNVRWYVENDPTRGSKVASGWWVQWPDFVLHSVVQIDQEYVCLTPFELGGEEFAFIPDPAIDWQVDGEFYAFVRSGQKVGLGVRRYPEFTLARMQLVREKLLRLPNPYDSLVFSEEEMQSLKREHLPPHEW